MRMGTFFSVVIVFFSFISVKSHPQNIKISSAEELQSIFQNPVDSVELYLQAGEYHLTPVNILDSTCGNCEDPAQPVPATAGLVIRGNYVKISGPADRSAVIHTHSGYGVFFNRCKSGIIENVSITGGERDSSQNATDAAIIAKNSTVIISNNRIFDNIGDSLAVVKNIVGIMGICGRENSRLTISGNEILRNSWDGIALYRDAKAIISGNKIDGVDKAGSKIAGGGRGVGIGVTWNANATIEGNLVKRYWKGIGIFVDASVTARNNIIEDILTWGIACWDAGKGAPVGMIENNIIFSTGACGASVTRSKPGRHPGHFSGNIIVKTAQNPKYDDPGYYCSQCALSVSAKPENFSITDNIFYNNRRASTDLPNYDITEAEFKQLTGNIKEKYLKSPLLQESDFARFITTL
ncbi:MAG: right-handed parallel beta-helix repeat-containing protein [Calditrichia bacterium]